MGKVEDRGVNRTIETDSSEVAVWMVLFGIALVIFVSLVALVIGVLS